MSTVASLLYALFIIHFLVFIGFNRWRIRKIIRFLESMDQFPENQKYHRLLASYKNRFTNKFQLLPDPIEYSILYESKIFTDLVIKCRVIFRYLVIAAILFLSLGMFFDVLSKALKTAS